MSKEISIPAAYNPRDYQLEFLSSPKRFKVAIWHRRGGKSKTALCGQVSKTQLPGLAGKTFYYILPTYSQARKVVWDELVKMHVPMEFVAKMNSSAELTIYYKNGSIQRFVGCDNYKNLKGINGIDFVLDEYQLIDKKVWTEVVKPIVSENGGSVTFIGTPEGRNQLWDILQFAKANPESWFESVKTVDDTKGIPEIQLLQDRKIMPEALFLQEYYCDFSENASGIFKRAKENVYDKNEIKFSHQFQIGVDLAKYNDWTVITPFDLNTFHVMPQERFNQVDWTLQKAKIEAIARRYNNARVVIDSTGVGDPITEDLENTGIDIVPFKFTEQSKKELLNNLAVMIEQDKIKIPNDEGLLNELSSMVYTRSDSGRLKMTVPKGNHDDRIMSLALAVWEVKEKIPLNNIMLPDSSNSYENYVDKSKEDPYDSL